MTDLHPTADPATLTARARDLDDADPLGAFVDEFVPSGEVVSYLDGNSLGRPLRALPDLVTAFIEKDWGSGLIRSWDAGWMQRPFALGDRLGRIALGATAGQVFIGDSTTVLLYKAVRAAVAARPERTEIVIDDDNFPTDRYIVEGIAAETGRTVRWIHADPASGVTADQVREAVNDQTAAVLLSHVAYRSGWVADVPGITDIIHSAGAIAIWDLCHSAGVIPTELDAWDVDLAVGCTYKYLNGGPGSPAFGYVRTELQSRLQQPIQGWMGTADVFEMGPSYRPALGIRRFVSGTPAIFAMLAMDAMLDLIERAGIDAVYAKSIRLTDFAEQSLGVHVLPHGARLESPQRGAHRGSHLTVAHPAFRDLTPVVWEQGVIPDFRAPDGIRIGLSPLSTTFAEVDEGIRILAEELARAAAAQK